MITRSSMMVLFLLMLAGAGYAQGSMGSSDKPSQVQEHGQSDQGMGMQKNSPPRVPPQFAIDACQGKSEGTACEISTPDGNKSGVCASTPDKKYFACRPNDMKMPSQGQEQGQGSQGMGDEQSSKKNHGNGNPKVPPQFAIDACQSKSEGTACEISDPNGNKSGTCATTPDKKYFACIPNDTKIPSQGQRSN